MKHASRKVTPTDIHHITEEDLLAESISLRNEIISLGCIPACPVNIFEEEKEVPPSSPSVIENNFKVCFGEVIALPDRGMWEPVPRRFTLLSDKQMYWDRQLDLWQWFLRYRERRYKKDAKGSSTPLPSPSEVERHGLLRECCDYIAYTIYESKQPDRVKRIWRGYRNGMILLLGETP